MADWIKQLGFAAMIAVMVVVAAVARTQAQHNACEQVLKEHHLQ